MRNREEEGIPLVNIERNPLVIVVAALLSAIVAFYNVQLFKDVNPLAFIMMTPTLILMVQTLWLVLTPFAIIYEDKIEIRQSFFHRKGRYFIDIKQISENKNGKVFIVYNDDEVEFVNLFGIKPSHLSLLVREVQKSVSASIKTRL